ncbi:sporulation related protein [Hoeflea sp. IMCC20628]|uniref:SPOR domain-containing protein n=1 Tax=Hoeflea sp. IMCC20628 TaxID=1620421 RepID=UPI00063BEB38|nr:SPOR domain-containing protein [Hoeflea sp. IMCC20628]AKI00476.1 sporulation related protein [Hoeflea sp. IMCC20628]
MVDLLDNNTRSPNPDAEIDDPLAELARIIGYERPAPSAKTTDKEPDSGELDLEAELMRELDVPQPVEADDPDNLADQTAPDESVASQESVQADEPAAEDPWDEVDDDLELVLDDSEILEPETESAADEEDVASDVGPAAGPETAQAAEYAPDSRDVENDNDNLSDWDFSESLDSEPLSDTVSEPDEIEFVFDVDPDLTSEELNSFDDDLADTRDIPGLDTDQDEAEREDANESAPAGQTRDKPGEVIAADFAAGCPVVIPDHSEDDVFADMVRFDVPARENTVPPLLFRPATDTEMDEVANEEPLNDVSAFEGGFSGDLDGSDADLIDNEPGFEAESAAVDTDEPASSENSSEPALDFEAYLSTELDVFEHEVAMSDADAAADQDEDVAPQQDRSAIDAEAGEGEWTADDLDDHSSVFDEAAEELLADIAYDDTILEADNASDDVTETWSVDSIEDGVAEELDEELENMYDLPVTRAEPIGESVDETDEFELDIEQVLAETLVEREAPSVVRAQTSPDTPVSDDVDEMDDWQLDDVVAESAVERDEISDAFLDFGQIADTDTSDADVASEPEDRSNASNAAIIAPEIAGEPQQSDWLSGFETSDPTARSDDDDYYFDANLISEPGDTLEAVTDIDVPELIHDEPLSVDPDYDSEIDREFADIVDRHEPEPEAGAAAAVTGDLGFVEGWSRSTSSSRGNELSSEYIELERELGVDHDSAARIHGAPVHEDSVLTQDEILYDEANREAGSRGPVLALVVLGLALLAGAGALGWSMWSDDQTTADGGPRIIRADTDPVKVLPENPGGVTVPNQDKAVYDRVAGGDGAPTGQPTLVNSAEEPVDVVQRTLDPEILPLEGRGDISTKSEDRLLANGAETEAGANVPTPPVVSPRKVRTMIVKPDGSIVAREDPEPQPLATETAAVEAEQTIVDTPEPKVPTMQVLQPDAVVAEVPATEPSAAALSATAGEEIANTSIAPVRVVTTQQIRPVSNAPVPQGRPADQPVNVVGTVTQGGNVAAAPEATPATAPAQPQQVAAAPAAAAPAANPGGYYMQIASQPSAEGAQASWNTLSKRYNSVLGGLSVDIQRADITGKGVFHRVRVPAGTKDQANALCSRYKSAGGSCFVSR